MDLEGELRALESVEDSEGITNETEQLGNFCESEVRNNGSSVVENDDTSEVSANVNPLNVDLKSEVSPSPTTTRKGYGLKKWRRIKRDANKGGESSIDTGKVLTREFSNSGVNPKRMQYADRRQKSEGSVSSTDAVVRNLDGFALPGDSGLGLGPPFATETDSDNSEDRSSKSSSAASAPKTKYEFLRDRDRMKSLSGKNLTHSVHRGQQVKGRIETSKKARGELVKIEKENSHSSLESDSRSSNFVFMQGTCSTNNGLRNVMPEGYDGGEGDEVQGGGQRGTHGHRGGYSREGEGADEELSTEDGAADSYSEIKEGSKNPGFLRDQDPLVEIQEAVEKELLKFKEIGKDVSVDDAIPDLSTELQSEVVELENRAVEAEIEELFKKKIETEVQYMAISGKVQKLRVAAVDHITVLEERKALASEQTQLLHKVGHAENKAVMLKKEAEKLERYCEDIVASADETLKLQKRVCKYSSCFFVQLVMLVLTLCVFVFQLSQNYVEIVPT